MKVIVCGSRNWPRDHRVTIVRELAKLPSNAVIITGGARGVDEFADAVARTQRRSRIIVPANWDRHGKAAGPIRNQLMLDLGPDLVIAFRATGESHGTDDMVRRAKKAGITVNVIHQGGEAK